MRANHVDGSECEEGTQRVPADFKPCCASFSFRTQACRYDIRYVWSESYQYWGILCADGNCVISLKYCPHCGTQVSQDEDDDGCFMG